MAHTLYNPTKQGWMGISHKVGEILFHLARLNGARSDKASSIWSSNRFWNELLFWQDCIWMCLKIRGLIPLKKGIPNRINNSQLFCGAPRILRRVHFNSETLEILMPGAYKTRTCLARFKWGLHGGYSHVEKQFLRKPFCSFDLFYQKCEMLLCKQWYTYGTHFHYTVFCFIKNMQWGLFDQNCKQREPGDSKWPFFWDG